MKGTYNNQNRKSGGYPKTKITVGKKVGGQSLPCDEQRHSDCDGYLTYFPHLKGYACQCDCHKKAKVTTKVEPTVEGWEVGYSKIMLDWIESQWKIEAAQQAGEPYTRMKFEADAHKVEQKLLTYIRTLLSHSLQEAKAEERKRTKKLIDAIHKEFKRDVLKLTNPALSLAAGIEIQINKYESALNTKASLKQEEEV